MFIGREAELKFLNDKYAENRVSSSYYMADAVLERQKLSVNSAKENLMFSFPAPRPRIGYSFAIFQAGF